MKKIVAVLFLLLCTTSLQAKDKPNPADYPVKMHISSTHFRNIFAQTPAECDLLVADVIVNGIKLELAGPALVIEKRFSLIRPGDYLAKLTKEVHNQDGSAFVQDYEILLPDGTIWKCYTFGISE